jgi:hypothetical protein
VADAGWSVRLGLGILGLSHSLDLAVLVKVSAALTEWVEAPRVSLLIWLNMCWANPVQDSHPRYFRWGGSV